MTVKWQLSEGCAVLLQIEFSPRLKHLAIIMGNLWTECVEVFTHFARLPNMLANKMSPKDVSAGKQFACVIMTVIIVAGT